MPGGELVIEAPELRVDPDLLRRPFAWDEVFGKAGPVEIEIGIGKGRFLLAAARPRPEVLHLGVEWANKYLRYAESRAARDGLENVRFARLDACEMMAGIPDRSVRQIYVFYPDPWPKKRHQKRRFLRRTNADQIARILEPGGTLHVATDHAHYWASIEPLFDAHPGFSRREAFGGERFPLPVEAPLTNFEAKYAREGRGRNRASWDVMVESAPRA